ncbi:molybdenum cofactor guanylyltransferase [Halobacteriaceae archaeon GCM10025711]
MRAGVILAGGRSTRFGDADKAVADLAGTPMIRRVADRLVDAVDELVVNCRADQRPAIAAALDGYEHDVTFALDPEPDRGPTAGIRTGLRAVDGEYAFVVACDMPFVEPELVDYLFERAAGHDVAIPRLDDYLQTMHAVYRADAMAAACQDVLDGEGSGRVIDAFGSLDVVVLPADEVAAHGGVDSFENLNSRAEFEDAAARL